MAEHVWSIVSKRAVIDRDSNNISLFDVIERISFHGPVEPDLNEKIVIPFDHTVTIYWARTNWEKPEKNKCKVTWGKNKELLSQVLEIDLTEFKRTRNILELKGFPFSGSGVYFFKIFLQDKKGGQERWKKVASIPIEVSFTPDPKAIKN